MADDEAAWAPFERLALMTVRLFYDLPEYYVMKALLAAPRQQRADGSHPEWQLDDKIAQRLKMTPVFVRKLLARLYADRLVDARRPKAQAKQGERQRACNCVRVCERLSV